jgi:hypothetical protein
MRERVVGAQARRELEARQRHRARADA